MAFSLRAQILREVAYNQDVRILTSANQVTMKRIITLSAVMSVLASLPSCICAARVDNAPVKSLDLTRYLGTWYEIARFNHSFERGMENVVAEYLMRDDGKIDVINSGWKDGKAKVAYGKAKLPDPDGNPALLRVSFFLFFYSDYRVLYIDEDYSVALVGGSRDKYLWILSRTPAVTDSKLEPVIRKARIRGYDTSKLIWVNQNMAE